MAKRNDPLPDFVRDALTAGASRTDVAGALGRAGWHHDQIDEALASYSDVAFAVPVPAPRTYVSAREAFLYLVLFSTLYLSAYALGSLLFNIIDQVWPDAVRPNYGSDHMIRWSIALLIVGTPVFVFTADVIRRMVKADPAKRGSAIRKWLTYIALFIAAAFLLGDVATLVFHILGGELTTRFLFKVATVAVIAGAIFAHFLFDLRRDERP